MSPAAWRRYLRFWGPAPEADVEDELRFHIESRVREYVAGGMSEAEARRRALDRFGSVERARQECLVIDREQERTMSRAAFFEGLRQDVTFAVRTLLRRPGWTAMTVATLGLGIGVNAAIFTLVSNYLFRPMPVRDADRLVVIGTVEAGTQLAGSTSYRNHLEMRALRDVFSDVTAFTAEALSLRAGAGEAERRLVDLVADNYFAMLGVQAQHGRMFTPEEVKARQPLIVLSHDYWRRRFGADPAVVGTTIGVNGLPFTVVGIAPERFTGTENLVAVDAYAPATLYPQLLGRPNADVLERRDMSTFRVLARLAPDVSVERARSGLATLVKRLEAQYPDQIRDISFAVAAERRSRPDIGVAHVMPRLAGVFMALVGLVLLIACANVAGLLLARGAARHHELSVRTALGASRGRLIRQLLTETLVLALSGAALGVALARVVTGALGQVKLAVDIPVRFNLEPDWRVYLFSLGAALVAALVAGLAPAFQGSQVDVAHTLRAGARSAGGARQRFRRMLVVAQVAVSLVVLICASLFTRSAREATRIDLGFRPDNLLLGSFDVSLRRYDRVHGEQFYRDLLERARALPGVRSAALGTHVPFGYNNNSVDVYVDQAGSGTRRGHTAIFYNAVSPDYFATMGIRMLAGRDFSVRDDSAAPRVAVVNAAMAARLWPGREPVGQHFRLSAGGPVFEVIGVVPTAKYIFISDGPRPFVYLPLAQYYRPERMIHLRTTVSPESVAPTLRGLAANLDPELPVYDLRSMREHLQHGIAFLFLHIGAALAAAFGLLGLVEAVVGLYGVISYSVVQRTREIGIRVALGAGPGDVVRAVLRQGITLTLAGLAVGAVLSLLVTRSVAGLLVGVGAGDAVSYVVAALVLTLCALVASLLPARRAARLSPVTALRAAE
jgi:putative ABC transport system permease protein